MNLLDHELVRKYFICPPPDNVLESPIRRCVCFADHVLQAMQEPIKKGEKILRWKGTNEVVEEIYAGDNYTAFGGSHPRFLRLPDRFQKKCCEYSTGEWQTNPRDGAAILICHSCLEKERKPKPETEKYESKIPQPWKAFIEGNPKNEIEEKIKEMMMIGKYDGFKYAAFENDLRELVDLARKTK